MTKDKIYQIIKKRLEKTKDCDFKKVFIPKGWTCIKINTFAKELTKEIKKLKGDR